jgi:pimeloyl-ACP methyl ester carboxylesterase
MTHPTLLFVHGAWHGPWCWEPVRKLLEERGWTTVAVDLPTVHAPDKAKLGMAADADAVRAAIDAIQGDVVVVAHSYGGVPTTQGAGAGNVVHIVFISAFVLDSGESLFAAAGGVQPDWWNVKDGLAAAGTSERPAQALFYADLPQAEADAAAARLTTQSERAYHDEITATSWRGRSTTFVITEHDAIFPPEAQEALAARAGASTVRLATSHSPFLSQPAAVADIIDRAARSGRPSGGQPTAARLT